jgi:hypothetical protein
MSKYIERCKKYILTTYDCVDISRNINFIYDCKEIIIYKYINMNDKY